MKLLQARGLRIAFILLAALGPARGVLGSGSEGAPDGGTRLPPTIRQVYAYLFSGTESKTVANLAAWAGTRPERDRAGFYHWRFADGKLVTVTTKTPAGEEITCWGREK